MVNVKYLSGDFFDSHCRLDWQLHCLS